MSEDASSRGQTDPEEAVTFGMTDLEEALTGPDGKAVRQDVIARLDALMSQVHERLRRGVEPHRFEATQKIYNALAAANGLMLRNTR